MLKLLNVLDKTRGSKLYLAPKKTKENLHYCDFLMTSSWPLPLKVIHLDLRINQTNQVLINLLISIDYLKFYYFVFIIIFILDLKLDN